MMTGAAAAVALEGGSSRSAPLPPSVPPGAQADSQRDVLLVLAATCDAGADQPSALTVAVSVTVDGRPVFRLADAVVGSPGMAALISDVTASDRAGRLPLVRGGGRDLELAATRDVVGTVTLRYRARSVPVSVEGGGRFALRHDATGIGGLGQAFLVLPELRRVRRVRIEWGQPVECGAGAGGGGLSSFGSGSVMIDATSGLDTLRSAVYFFGRPRVVTAAEGAAHVRTAWFGAPVFDVAAAAAWAARAYAAERALFADDDSGDYALFARVVPSLGDRSNGVGQPDSLLLAIGPRTALGPRLRINIAHEMLHRWLGLRVRLAGPDGSSFWFSEGFTVYYANVVMLRAGLVTPDEFLAELNLAATRQLANPYSAATNDAIRRDFFASDAVSVVPYTRGALYAAELDASIRRASRGARRLDDVMRELERAARAAHAAAGLPGDALRKLVVRELGQAGADRYDAVIVRGGQPAPPRDAFGPCFAGEPHAVATYELGFDERLSLVEPRAIRKLVAGSAAARAGLVEGDRLVSLESRFLDPEAEAAVVIERGGKQFPARYLPARAGSVREGIRWSRVSAVPDQQCRAW